MEISLEIRDRFSVAALLRILSAVAGRLDLPREAFSLLCLSFLMMREKRHEAAERLRNDLITLATIYKYTEEQQYALYQHALNAYRIDDGKELVEMLIDKVRKA